jgi:hypothetical protein
MTLARVTRKTTASNTGGLVSFLTVARASANRMIDAPLGMVSSWADGQPLYSTSFGGADWHWQADFPAATATDNETSCRPTSWIAGGLTGAAVRASYGNPFTRTQTAWTVDSTAADNEGATIVKTDAEIARRWGPDANIPIQTTITYAQAPSTTSDLSFAYNTDAAISFVGTPTINKPAVVLTVVNVQVRTAGANVFWNITGATLGAADVGKLAIITVSTAGGNVGAYARILQDNGGGNVIVSPFGVVTAAAPNTFAQVTPLVGDTIQVVTPMTLTVGQIYVRSNTQRGVAATPTRNIVTFDSMTLDGGNDAGASATFGPGSIFSSGALIRYVRCIAQNISFSGSTNLLQLHQFHGGGGGDAAGGSTVAIRSPSMNWNQTGFLNCIVAPITGGNCNFATDCYFCNSNLNINQGSTATTRGIAMFNRATASTALSLGASSNGGWGHVRQIGAVADWGSGNAGFGLMVRASSQYTYATKPTINSGLGAGRESSIGGVDTLYAAYPATGAVNLTNFAAAVLTA